MPEVFRRRQFDEDAQLNGDDGAIHKKKGEDLTEGKKVNNKQMLNAD